ASSLGLICVVVLFSACFLSVATSARSKSVMPGEGSPGSTHTGFKRSMEKPLKTGWLKKQRSIVKNWQLRFFVLRGNVLTYHKDDRETFQTSWYMRRNLGHVWCPSWWRSVRASFACQDRTTRSNSSERPLMPEKDPRSPGKASHV
uniref:PH domain-containing protein n=1 Tax=Sinocyclocheilus grahami TaxID=75366 RepID=A0A672M6S4_SINGR